MVYQILFKNTAFHNLHYMPQVSDWTSFLMSFEERTKKKEKKSFSVLGQNKIYEVQLTRKMSRNVPQKQQGTHSFNLKLWFTPCLFTKARSGWPRRFQNDEAKLMDLTVLTLCSCFWGTTNKIKHVFGARGQRGKQGTEESHRATRTCRPWYLLSRFRADRQCFVRGRGACEVQDCRLHLGAVINQVGAFGGGV